MTNLEKLIRANGHSGGTIHQYDRALNAYAYMGCSISQMNDSDMRKLALKQKEPSRYRVLMTAANSDWDEIVLCGAMLNQRGDMT